jgi:hypothetical protein
VTKNKFGDRSNHAFAVWTGDEEDSGVMHGNR